MRHFLLAIAAFGLGGCYPDYVEPSPYYGGGGYVSAGIPVGPPAAVSVSMAPPPLRYEAYMNCGYNQTYVRGYWDWRGGWYWAPGRCIGTVAGYVYQPPSYSGGVYIAGHWAGGGGYRGGYGYRPGYVAPAPAYRPAYGYRPGYVAPAPAYRPAYVPPPAPAYRPAAPVYRPAYVPPPAPAYRAPAPAYRAPAPAYRPAPARVSAPPPAPAYRWPG